MKVIDYNELKQFINSDATEIEFYGLNKENLISLKEYINILRTQKEKFNRETLEALKSIQSKISGIIDVKPEFDRITLLKLICKSPNMGISLSQDYNDWYGTNRNKIDQLPFMVRKQYIMKLDQIERGIISEELDEIKRVYEESFKGIKNHESASERFNIATKNSDNIIESAVYAPLSILDKKIITRAPITYIDDNGYILNTISKSKELDKKFRERYVNHEHIATNNYNTSYVKEISPVEKEKLKNKIYIKM